MRRVKIWQKFPVLKQESAKVYLCVFVFALHKICCAGNSKTLISYHCINSLIWDYFLKWQKGLKWQWIQLGSFSIRRKREEYKKLMCSQERILITHFQLYLHFICWEIYGSRCGCWAFCCATVGGPSTCISSASSRLPWLVGDVDGASMRCASSAW